MLDTARYWLALILVVSFPPAFLYWFVIHPFADFWRQLGPLKTHLIVGPSMILVGFGIYLCRDFLMRVAPIALAGRFIATSPAVSAG